MDFPDYFFFLASVCGSYAVGITLYRTGPVQSLILGLLSQGLILGVTIWFLPSATEWLLTLVQLGAVLYVLFQRPTLLSKHFWIAREGLVQPSIYVSFLLALAFTDSFSLHEYPFNSHDSVYWGYVFESLRADYSGPIISPVLAPLALPVTHVLPMMSLTTLLAYVPNLTLLNIIAAKHLVIVFFFWRAGWFLLTQIGKRKLAYGVILIVSLLFIFESELGYNLMVSSFIYEIILVELVILLSAKRIDMMLVLLLFLTLIAARASLSFAAMGASGILAWHLRENLKLEAWLIGGLVAANVATWLILPKPLVASSSSFLCSESQLTLVNPFSLAELAGLSAIGNWVLPSSLTHMIYNFIDTLQSQYHVGAAALSYCIVGLFLIYIFLKFFLPILLWIRTDLKWESGSMKSSTRALLVYLAFLWGGMFVVRIGGSPDHQFHGFLVLAIFSFFALFRVSINNQLVGALVVALGIHGAFFDGITSYPFSAILSQGIQKEHLNYEADSSWSSAGPPRLWHEEVKILAAGQQRSLSELSENQFRAYFSGEPADVESIASLWVVPSDKLRQGCNALNLEVPRNLINQ